MNEIVSQNKKIELQDYKLIYPNDKNLKVNFTDNYTVARLIIGADNNELNLLENYSMLINCLLLKMCIKHLDKLSN